AKHIGVMATCATIQSSSLAGLVARFSEGATVTLKACPGWVEILEEARMDEPASYTRVRDDVWEVLEQGADVLVLGCTHYTFLADLIKRAIREAGLENIKLITTHDAVAKQVKRVVQCLEQDTVFFDSSNGVGAGSPIVESQPIQYYYSDKNGVEYKKAPPQWGEAFLSKI
ncbi:MAG: aspartate/glutamate racemase family protein, partial [Alphaproteobacteria bacterium]|nr:aspartate/glutamate racemase family protein [Alphaproteobacteria bacterium]